MNSNQQPTGLDPVEQKVKAHWLKHRPKMSAKLQQQNRLDHSVRQATNLMRASQAD